MSINYEILGDRIRLVRTSRDLSQEKLAEAANLTRESINRIEKGSLKAKLDTIAVIASILNIPIDYLIGNEKDLTAHHLSSFPYRLRQSCQQCRHLGIGEDLLKQLLI